jgi:phosphoribosylformylglycinamidine synthase
MAAKAGAGMEIDLDLVPQREEGMTPYEIMLSESQERMLICAKKEKVGEVQAIFAKWDLDAVVIGHVTEGGRLKVKSQGKDVVDIPVDAVVNLCPAYRRPIKTPEFLRKVSKLPEIPLPADLNEVFFKVISSPAIADKEWVFRQYDHMIQINTALLPGADAAVLRIKGSKKALAMTLDGNSLYTYLDPRQGARIAVSEACRNLACVGARPIGVTNCLNFGNPEKPEVMWQFKEAVGGMAEACRAFEIPVTGGNVSFYNDTEGASIHPTPVLGVVGIIEDIGKAVRPGFRTAGDTVILLGENKEELGGSEYLKVCVGLQKGHPPGIDLAVERKVQEMCLEAITGDLLRSAHDVSDGGLAVCLAECAFHSGKRLGCSIDLGDRIRADALLFGESQSRIVVTAGPRRAGKVLALASKRKVKARVIGRTGGRDIVVRVRRREVIRVPVGDAFKAWKESIPSRYKVKE